MKTVRQEVDAVAAKFWVWFNARKRKLFFDQGDMEAAFAEGFAVGSNFAVELFNSKMEEKLRDRSTKEGPN